MASDKSLDRYIGKAAKRYSSLFTLPSRRTIILSLCILCIFGGVSTILPLSFSYNGLALGLMFGVSLFFIIVLSDFMITQSCMKTDHVFNLRRCLILSLFSSLFWLGFTFLGAISSIFFGNSDLWIKFFLFGFYAALILRLLVFSTASFADRGSAILSSLLQPILCIIPILFMNSVIKYDLTSLFIFFSLSIPIAVVTVFLFTILLDNVGKKTLGMPSLFLFKAFLVNWTENVSAPLERIFERLGDEMDIRLSLLAFRSGAKVKAVIVVPECHPGPFRNVGSSLLPYMIQDALEDKLECVASVPHGLLGHDFDLSSQLQSRKVVEGVLSYMDFSHFNSKITPFIRTRKSGASASCQIFGDCAFVTLTMAPKTMEDLPQKLASHIVGEAENRGLPSPIVIDAHNSINGPFELDEATRSLRKVAVTSLEEALSTRRSSFEVGVAKVIPKEFGVKEGMGPGGISVIITKVGDQKTAYVTIDGNNMVSGLREKILVMLREIGIVDGEILTTDTHAVTGVVPTARGYYPIGEAIDNAKLIGYIREATVKALDDLTPAEVSRRTGTVPNVKVIGEKPIADLCVLVDEAMKQAKRLAISLISAASILLIGLLILI
ncbi:MAG: DUF2070 family protein [Candidatus Bathyarchaeota archaeon]|nr:MAG: DUF2070 family protein [Candidatus Bathyarchaeota archaeon]